MASGTEMVEVEQAPASASGLSELRALTRLAFDELAGFPAGIAQIHAGIAQRAFRGVRRGVGPAARPVELVHDAVTRSVYGTLRGGAKLLGHAADAALERRRLGERWVLSRTRSGSALIAALNGLIGDRLEHEANPLHQPAAVRVDGQPIELERYSLARAFPGARPRLVVFLHGLMETEFSWRPGDAPPYGSRLERDLGCSAIYVRYNSGRHVSENGRSVMELLAALTASWPVDVDEIALVGHSMGGLVARSACYQGSERGLAWTRRVRHVVSLGTPHLGAPLEQAVHVTSAALSALPETRPLGAYLRRRSAGIRDLRHGSLVDEDWEGCDPDALRAAACREIPLLECATHCFVSASLTRSERHPIGRLVGDCLVLVPSASGRGRTRRIPFRAEHGAHVGATHHFALLNHPAVYARLRDWLATPPEVLAAA